MHRQGSFSDCPMVLHSEDFYSSHFSLLCLHKWIKRAWQGLLCKPEEKAHLPFRNHLLVQGHNAAHCACHGLPSCSLPSKARHSSKRRPTTALMSIQALRPLSFFHFYRHAETCYVLRLATKACHGTHESSSESLPQWCQMSQVKWVLSWIS